MEQTALRPKPMPGRSPGRSPGDHSEKGRRPYAVRRRGRRLTAVLGGLLLAVLLVLAGVGIGTVGVTVIGMGGVAETAKAAAPPGALRQAAGGLGAEEPKSEPSRPEPSKPAPRNSGAADGPAPASANPAGASTLGVEAVDAPDGRGALLVGVHLPGPGYAAGLVRGDTLLAFGGVRVGSAAALASAVAAAQPGKEVPLTVRHKNGNRQILSVRPGIVT
ncbi:PDZ domain-containing protein [Streptomyces alboniger]|uniref:PDZ domain-containing protein n=1 Tax=Streptomyces alboniger TaxID=132473 RepID=A0A5J6HKV6_STRAD|nr:PDZ domain-containing protein [Streptomyces alboniger]QEV20949.1 PDZ domain-containing protein [Streptomyces alboniger]